MDIVLLDFRIGKNEFNFMDKGEIIVRYIKIIFTCLRHGINPFSPIGKNIGKVAERFSEKEKQFYIDACKSEYSKEYLRKAFKGEK